MKKYIFFLFLSFVFCGCSRLKNHERPVVGDYVVYNFIGNSESFSKQQCTLSINDDHTFVFINKGKEFKGNWEAKCEAHNITVVKFNARGFDTQGIIFEKNQINILKAELYIDKTLKDISFRKE